MKLAQVNKMYKELTPHEQAAMCVEATVRGDYDESEAIRAAVPMRAYSCADYEFRKRTYGLYTMAQFYGVCFWRARVQMLTSKEPDCFMEVLAAIDAALIETCDKYKVDAESIKVVAQCLRETALTGYAKPELIAKYAELFSGLIE